jgi:hypothetical protein
MHLMKHWIRVPAMLLDVSGYVCHRFALSRPTYGVGQLSRYSDGLRSGRPAFDTRQGQEISAAFRPSPRLIQPPIMWVGESIFGVSDRSMKLTARSRLCSAEANNNSYTPYLLLPIISSWHCTWTTSHFTPFVAKYYIFTIRHPEYFGVV